MRCCNPNANYQLWKLYLGPSRSLYVNNKPATTVTSNHALNDLFPCIKSCLLDIRQ